MHMPIIGTPDAPTTCMLDCDETCVNSTDSYCDVFCNDGDFDYINDAIGSFEVTPIGILVLTKP